MSDTITITPPSFKATVPMLRLMVEDGSVDARDFAWEEVTRWAAMLDEAAKAERIAKQNSAPLSEPCTEGGVITLCDVCRASPAQSCSDRGVNLCAKCSDRATKEWGS